MTSGNNSHGRPRNTGRVEYLYAKGAGRIRTAIIFTVFAVIFGFSTITSFIQQSPTIDEPIHLLAGYAYVRWGDFRVNPEHPPFGKIWAALPLMALRIADPRSSSPYWNQILETEPGGPVYPLAHEMFFVRNDATTLFFYAKLQMIVLSMVLAAFIYRWTQQLFGFRAGVIALFLYGLDPNILAHSAIVHTDLPPVWKRSRAWAGHWPSREKSPRQRGTMRRRCDCWGRARPRGTRNRSRFERHYRSEGRAHSVIDISRASG
jgi:hypothetical protein